MNEARERLVIIGAGAAGLPVASQIRKETRDKDITVITLGRVVAYSPCALPFVLHGMIHPIENIIMKSPADYEAIGIHMMLETRVESIDLKGQVVHTDKGPVGYDILVIATGAKAFVPPITGVDAKGVHTLRWYDDCLAIEESLKGISNTVIVGAGAIGLEVATALLHRGLRVTIVELLPYVLPLILDQDMAQMVHTHLMDQGARVIVGSAVSEVLKDDGGRVRAVRVGDEVIPAEFVLMGTGVRPDAELAKAAGIEIGPTGGIVADGSLHVKVGRSFLPNVYASGDCVEVVRDFTFARATSPLGTSAHRLAMVVANNIMGRNVVLHPFTSPNVCVVGNYHVGSVGLTTHMASLAGIQVQSRIATGPAIARYFPGKSLITIKLLIDSSRRIVGGQMIGEGGGVKSRIDALSVAMASRMKVDDLATVETCYAPPVSALVDPLTLAAQSFTDVC
jgi:NADH oxidase (H2O2-forming)